MLKIEKLFFAATGIFAVILCVLLYRMVTVLESSESAEAAQFIYHDTGSMVSYAVPAFYVTLMIMANVVFVKMNKGRYFVWSYLFFAVFTIADYVFAGESYFHFTQRAGFGKGGFSVIGLAGLFLCFFAFMVTLANYLICHTFKKIKSKKS